MADISNGLEQAGTQLEDIVFTNVTFSQNSADISLLLIGDTISGENSGDFIGMNVSINNNGTVVTAPSHEEDFIKIYQRDDSVDGSWIQLGGDISDSTYSGEAFGFCSDLNGDGTRIVIGIPGADIDGFTSTGAVQIYDYSVNADNSWVQIGGDICYNQTKSNNNKFGIDVAINSDGTRIVICGQEGNPIDSGSGFVQVYQYDATSDISWSQLGSDFNMNSKIYSVDMNRNGSIIAIGQQNAVEIYEYGISETWLQLGSDITGTDQIVSVALNDNGDILVIGSIDDTGVISDSGIVKVYSYDGLQWSQLGNTLIGSSVDDFFGVDVAIDGIGHTISVASYKSGGSSSGHFSVWKYETVTNDTWTLVDNYVTGNDGILTTGQYYVLLLSKNSVALSSDGNTVVFGSTNDGLSYFGSIHMYNIFNNSEDVLYSVADVSNGFKLRYLDRDTDISTVAFSVTNKGKIGVATETPQYTFDVSGDINASENIYIDGSAVATVNYVDVVLSDLNIFVFENSLNTIETDLNIAESKLIDLSNDVTVIDSSLSDLSNNVSTNINAISNIDSSLTDLSNNVSVNITVISNIDSSLSDLSNNVTANIIAISNIDTSLSDLSNNVSTNINAISNIDTSLSDLSNNVTTNINAISNIDSSLSDLSNNVTTNNISITIIDASLTLIESSLNKLDASANAYDISFTDIYSQIEDISLIVYGLDGVDLGALDVSVADLNNRVDIIDVSIGLLETSMNLVDVARFDTLDTSVNLLEISMNNVNTRVNNVDTSLSDLSNNVTTNINAISNIDSSLSDLSNNVTINITAISNIDVSINILDTSMDAVNARVDIADASINNLTENAFELRDISFSDISYQHPSSILFISQIGSDLSGDVGSNDAFGSSVSINGDGSIIVVGIPNEDVNGSNNGLAKIYQLNNGEWTQYGGDLSINTATTSIQFGHSVDINNSGDIVVVSANQFHSGSVADSGIVSIFKFDENVDGSWVKYGEDISSGLQTANENFGTTVACDNSGHTIIIGAFDGEVNTIETGYIQVYRFDENVDGSWVQYGTTISGDTLDDKFGWSVDINGNGNIIAVGAYDSDINGTRSGQVKIFQIDDSVDGSWIQIGDDISGESSNDYFGINVAINRQGNRIVASAGLSDVSGTNTGYVKVFERNDNIDGSWTQIGQTLFGSSDNDYFGNSVDINDVGDRIGITTGQKGINTQGTAFIYRYIDTSWVLIDEPIDDVTGGSGTVTIVKDIKFDNNGNRVIYSNIDAFSDDGAVRVYDISNIQTYSYTIADVSNGLKLRYFERDTDISKIAFSVTNQGKFGIATEDPSYTLDVSGTINSNSDGIFIDGNPVATQNYVVTTVNNANAIEDIDFTNVNYTINDLSLQLLQKGDDISDGVGNGNYFGSGIALNNDGSFVAIGAPFFDGTNTDIGKVAIYKFDETIDGSWIQYGGDISSGFDNNIDEFFGHSVDINGDGDLIVIGAYGVHSAGISDAGIVQIWQYDPSVDNSWVKFGEDISSGVQTASENFGWAVACDNSGHTIIIGARNGNGGATDSGYAQIYRFDDSVDGSWAQYGTTINGDSADDRFGWSVDITRDGNTVIIGAPSNDTNQTDGGIVKIYEFDSGGTNDWVQIGNDISGTDTGSNGFFGYSCAINSDGTIVAVGAYGETSTANRGNVYVYQRNDALDGSWIQLGNVLSGFNDDDAFGVSVDLDNTGYILSIASNTSGSNTNGHFSVYKYNSNSSSWDLFDDYVAGADGTTSFTLLVNSIPNKTVLSSNGLVSAYSSQVANTNDGTVYVYDIGRNDTEYLYSVADVSNGFKLRYLERNTDASKVALTLTNQGYFGIATQDPAFTLDISGNVRTSGGNLQLDVISEFVNPSFLIQQYDTKFPQFNAFWKFNPRDVSDGATSELVLSYNDNEIGYFNSGTNNADFTFTGQHRNLLQEKNNYWRQNSDKIKGFTVYSTGNYINAGVINYNGTADNGIYIDDALPIVNFSHTVNDKRIYGVISDAENINNGNIRSFKQGFIGHTEQKQNDADNRFIINSVGEGAIWVCDICGAVNNGDYLTTSIIPGIAMIQNDDLLHNYTIAKSTTDCDFSNVNIPVLSVNTSLDNNGEYTYDNVVDTSGNNKQISKYKRKWIIIQTDKYVIHNNESCDGTDIWFEFEYDFQNNSPHIIGNKYVMAFIGCTYHCG